MYSNACGAKARMLTGRATRPQRNKYIKARNEVHFRRVVLEGFRSRCGGSFSHVQLPGRPATLLITWGISHYLHTKCLNVKVDP